MIYYVCKQKRNGDVNMYEYKMQGRNGYWAVDLYKDDKCLRNVAILRTKKEATTVTGELNNALELGKQAMITETFK